MNILAIETSGDVCGVAVCGEDAVLSESSVNRKYAHAEVIIKLVGENLKRAGLAPKQLTGIAVSIGPGSFTGLRIGLSAAKGLCYALDIPIVAIETPDIIFARVSSLKMKTAVVLPVRKSELYVAIFDNDRRQGNIKTVSVDNFLKIVAEEKKLLVTGQIPDGVRRKLESLRTEMLDPKASLPTAAQTGLLSIARFKSGDADDLDQLVPLYVKDFAGIN